MNETAIVWCVIATFTAIALIIRIAEAISGLIRSKNNDDSKRTSLFDIARERDIFYVPGDRTITDKDLFDDL